MNFTAIVRTAIIVIAAASAAFGQQRPLLTEDPRTVEDGAIVTELGMGYEHRARFPLSGLTGDHWSILQNGLNAGLGDRAEFQIGGVAHHYLRLENGQGSRNDWGDAVLSTKIRVVDEGRFHPIVTFRPTVVVPNSNDSKGIGTDTMNFFASLLFGKTVGRTFIFGNLGLGILEDAVRASEQHDVLVYGIAATVPLNGRVNAAAEWNGLHNAVDNPTPGGESRGQARLGLQIKTGNIRWDVGATAGTSNVDHKAGLVFGATKTFRWRR